MNEAVSMQVAETIRDQIGGQAIMMLGAHQLMAGKNGSLSFRIKGSRKVNYIKIRLNSMDLYDMEFGRIYGLKYQKVSEEKNVYFDMLNTIIEEHTGLYTKL